MTYLERKDQIATGLRLYLDSWKHLRPQDKEDTGAHEGTQSQGAASPLMTVEQKEELVTAVKDIAATGKVAFDATRKEIKGTDFRQTALEWLVVFRESSTAFLEGFREGKNEDQALNTDFSESFKNAFERLTEQMDKTKK